MTTLAHATLIMERTYKAAPARVFAAWESVEARLRWSAPTEATKIVYDRAEFREGGVDVSRCIEPGLADFVAEVHYLNIQRDSRIVFAESVRQGGKQMSAALISVEIAPKPDGAYLLLTMQIAAFDGSGMEAGYQQGWTAALDNLVREFER
jgi:uncharacterized protein YndB with AHSA1/START domain